MKLQQLKFIPSIFSKRFQSYATSKDVPKESQQHIESIIGLEIHAQLLTKSKLFSLSPVNSDAASNSAVSNFDLGIPGTLPSLNKECVQKSLCAALLLKSEIQPMCRFDRKHYFYPDMPLGYQITQQDYPIARGGYFEYYWDDATENSSYSLRKVRLKQIQLEMDSGKIIRADSDRLYVDFNRAGVGLIEMVTEPDLRSSAEAATFVDQLRLLLIQNQICAGELHRGNMRVDANVSLRIDGKDYPRTEIKNISSIRSLENAINNEIIRQKNLIENGETILPVTLNLDDNDNVCVVREKGDGLDYRFTPEPNLHRLRIEQAWIINAQQKVKNVPEYFDYIHTYRMKPSEAIELVKNTEKNEFVQKTLPQIPLSIDEYFAWLIELEYACEHTDTKFPPNISSFHQHFVDLVNGVSNKLITKLTCIDLMKRYLKDEISEPVKEVVEIESLKQYSIDDPTFIEIFDEVCSSNTKTVEKIKMSNGKPLQKALNKLRNEIISKCAKRISVKDAELAISRRFNP